LKTGFLSTCPYHGAATPNVADQTNFGDIIRRGCPQVEKIPGRSMIEFSQDLCMRVEKGVELIFLCSPHFLISYSKQDIKFITNISLCIRTRSLKNLYPKTVAKRGNYFFSRQLNFPAKTAKLAEKFDRELAIPVRQQQHQLLYSEQKDRQGGNGEWRPAKSSYVFKLITSCLVVFRLVKRI